MYDECTSADDTRPWCVVESYAVGGPEQWGYCDCPGTCDGEQPDDAPEDGNPPCAFPFTYLGVTFGDCTTVDDANGRAWCITEGGGWGYCDCGPTPPTLPPPTPAPVVGPPSVSPTLGPTMFVAVNLSEGCSAGSLPAGGYAAGASTDATIGDTAVRVSLPPGYAPGDAAPIALLFHGYGGRGRLL